MFSLPESLTALLIPLPFVLGSAASLNLVDTEGIFQPISAYTRLSLVLSGKDGTGPASSLFSGLLPAAGLTTTILLCSGLIARQNTPEGFLGRRKLRHKRDSSIEDVITQAVKPGSVADVFSRIFSLLLPLFAAFKLGSVQVSLILLAATIAGSTNTGNSKLDTLSEKTRALFTNKFTLGALILQILYDIWRTTTKTAAAANASCLVLGYMALILSLAAFQLPLPSIRRRLNIAGSGSSFTSAGVTTWVAPTLTSSLTSTTQNADMTLVSAFVLFVPTVLGVLASPSSISWMYSSGNIIAILSVVSGIAVVFSAELTSIRKRGRAGLAIISLAMSALLVFNAHSRTERFASVLPSLLMAGVELDHALQLGKSREHGHHHHHDNHAHKKHSAFTGFLLDHCDEHGVLHGILLEKDSRRILYFTT